MSAEESTYVNVIFKVTMDKNRKKLGNPVFYFK